MIGMSQLSFAGELNWKISRQWDDSEEALFSEFIQNMGVAIKKGICTTADNCIKNPQANPLFYKRNPARLKNIFADCADLPYVLRTYFAFMRELPFVFPKGVTFYSPEIDSVRKAYYEAKREYDRYSFFSRPREVRKRYKALEDQLEQLLKEAGKDIRYSRSGNKITGLRKISQGDSINTVLNEVVGNVSTAIFRVHGGLFDKGSVFRDTYPVEITRDAIFPGTVLYDPAGHIAIVAEVTKSGKIYLIDAHPDNSITYIAYGEKFSRSPINRGAGFVRFRPYQKSGSNYIPTPNSQLSDFSLEQYFGTENDRRTSWRKVDFNFNGADLPFTQFVRARLSLNGLSIDPIEEAKVMFSDLCRDFQDRVASVEKAISDNINRKSHPNALPENIYGTDGEWETYSTPSRDARLKASVREIYNTTASFIGVGEAPNFTIDYQGRNLRLDLKNVYKQSSASCELKVLKSNGQTRKMNLDEAIDRLFKFSFNPYVCPELRWGLSGDELATCSQDNEKWEWYRASQSLRNQIDRDYSKFMGFSLRELPGSGIGVKTTPEFDFHQLLE